MTYTHAAQAGVSMLSFTRIGQFHAYTYEPLGETKERVAVRTEHKVEFSFLTYPDGEGYDVMRGMGHVGKLVDHFLDAFLHEHLMVRRNDAIATAHYVSNKADYKGLYIAAKGNTPLDLAKALLSCTLRDKTKALDLLLYRVLVRRSDQEAQYDTVTWANLKRELDDIKKWELSAKHLKKAKDMLKPIGEGRPVRTGKSANFRGKP